MEGMASTKVDDVGTCLPVFQLPSGLPLLYSAVLARSCRCHARWCPTRAERRRYPGLPSRHSLLGGIVTSPYRLSSRRFNFIVPRLMVTSR